jgi:SsrA-binding protein
MVKYELYGMDGNKMVKKNENDSDKVIADNRKARHEYHFLETWEAGVALQGSEVKSCRMGQMSLADSYAIIRHNELILLNAHIAPYAMANQFNHDPRRDRKLLLHRSEIDRIIGKLNAGGLTLIPVKVYLKNGLVKVLLALAKGKKLYDKRAELKKKAIEREMRAERSV